MSAAGPVFIHIGLPKTATTYVQAVLFDARRELAEQGLLYPGPRNHHYLSVVDLQGQKFAGNPVAQSVGVADALFTQIREWDGCALYSHELLAGLRPRRIAKMLPQFGDRDVHVVMTWRDISEVLPATWQERAKNQTVESWRTYVEQTRRGPEGGHDFWRLQNVPGIVDRWLKFVSAERFHVVTLPKRADKAAVLLERFCSVLGVEVPHPKEGTAVRNPSLGATEVALLHRINAVTRSRYTWDEYHRIVKGGLVQGFLSKRPGQVRVELDESNRPWVDAATRRAIEHVESAGCDVVGSLTDLGPTAFSSNPDARPDEVSTENLLQAAVEVLVDVALARDQGRRSLEDRLDKQRLKLATHAASRAGGVPVIEPAGGSTLERIVREMAQSEMTRRWVRRAADAYRTLRDRR